MPKQNLPADLMRELVKEQPDFANCRSIIDWDANAAAYSDAEGQTPLMLASRFKYSTIAEQLIEKGAPVNAADLKGSTAVHYAVYGRRPRGSLIRLLCQKGADINAHNMQGDTPLHAAVLHYNLPALQLLVELGAKTQETNMQGETPLQLAQRLGRDPAYVDALQPPVQIPPGAEPLSLTELGEIKISLKAAFVTATAAGAGADPLTVAHTARALLDVDARLREANKGPKP